MTDALPTRRRFPRDALCSTNGVFTPWAERICCCKLRTGTPPSFWERAAGDGPEPRIKQLMKPRRDLLLQGETTQWVPTLMLILFPTAGSRTNPIAEALRRDASRLVEPNGRWPQINGLRQDLRRMPDAQSCGGSVAPHESICDDDPNDPGMLTFDE